MEWGLHGTFTAIDSGRTGLVAGPWVALRTLGSARAVASLGVGTRSGAATGRGQLALEYLLSPRAAGRVGVYAGGGLAGVVGAGKGGYLLAYVGVERSPGLSRGWSLEAGLGGGYQLRAAFHWRRFPPGWRPRK